MSTDKNTETYGVDDHGSGWNLEEECCEHEVFEMCLVSAVDIPWLKSGISL